MALFQEEVAGWPFSLIWQRIHFGDSQNNEKLLFDEKIDLWQRIMFAEQLYQKAKDSSADLETLKSFEDFCAFTLERKKDPDHDSWIYIYKNIGERHRNFSLDQVVELLAKSNALLPFLKYIPDKVYFDKIYPFSAFIVQCPEIKDDCLKNALQNDNLPYFKLLQSSPTASTGILYWVIQYHAWKILNEILSKQTTSQLAQYIIEMHTTLESPEILLPIIQNNVDRLAQWRDAWKNPLFWYFYRRPHTSKEFWENLPDPIVESAEQKNVFDISAQDLWEFYRPRVKFNSNTQNISNSPPSENNQ